MTKKINLDRCGLKFDEICVLVTVKPAPSGVDYYFFFEMKDLIGIVV